MVRLPFLLAPLLCLTGVADAAERRVSVGSFDRVRIDGPFEVTYATGSPQAKLSGDARAIEEVELRVEGSTLKVRRKGQGWGERPRSAAATAPITIVLSSPSLAEANVLGGGRLTIARPKGRTLELFVAGAGEIAVADAAAEQLSATLAGTGVMTLTGRARTVKLATQGPGRIDASALQADDVSVLLDGRGETRAAARHTAKVTNTGLGSVTVTGKAKCTVTARAGGPVLCGVG